MKADDAVTRGVIATHNPVIETILAEDRAESQAQGKADAVVAMFAAFDGALWTRPRPQPKRASYPRQRYFSKARLIISGEDRPSGVEGS